MRLVGRDIFFLCGHVVPIDPRPRFDFLPLQTDDAGQLHGFAEDRFCCRRHVHTHRLAHMDWKGHLRQFHFAKFQTTLKTPTKQRQIIINIQSTILKGQCNLAVIFSTVIYLPQLCFWQSTSFSTERNSGLWYNGGRSHLCLSCHATNER